MIDNELYRELDFLNNDRVFAGILDKKISGFSMIFDSGTDLDVFFELMYCLMTAQTKFYSSAAVVSELKKDAYFENKLLNYSDTELQEYLLPFLCKNIIRFHNNKSKNIVHARNLFLNSGKLQIKTIVNSFDSEYELRNWMIQNVKGFSCKEASHFLRNIGKGKHLAILDRHILRMMSGLGIIDKLPKTLPAKLYYEYEKYLIEFANKNFIDVEKLDFYLFLMSKAVSGVKGDEVYKVLVDLK